LQLDEDLCYNPDRTKPVEQEAEIVKKKKTDIIFC
jgi:hypothetical protein